MPPSIDPSNPSIVSVHMYIFFSSMIEKTGSLLRSTAGCTESSSSSSSFRGGTADVNDDGDYVHPAVDLNKLPVLSIIEEKKMYM